MKKDINIKYILDSKESGSRKIPITIHRIDVIKELTKHFQKLDESNKWSLFFYILDNFLSFIIEKIFYFSYKINFFLFILIGEYRQKIGYKKTESVKFQKKFTDSELEEFSLLIGKDFTDSQIKDCISIKKGILIDSWRQIKNIRDYRKKLTGSL